MANIGSHVLLKCYEIVTCSKHIRDKFKQRSRVVWMLPSEWLKRKADSPRSHSEQMSRQTQLDQHYMPVQSQSQSRSQTEKSSLQGQSQSQAQGASVSGNVPGDARLFPPPLKRGLFARYQEGGFY